MRKISILAAAAILSVSLLSTEATTTTVKAERVSGSQLQRELKQVGMAAEEKELLYLVCMCEAGNQSTEGIRAVCGTILNRVDDKRFPNTITGVVYQKKPAKQFSCVWDGAFSRWTPTDKVRAAVDAEIENRSIDSLYFKTKSYHRGTTPIKPIGAHYFSK